MKIGGKEQTTWARGRVGFSLIKAHEHYGLKQERRGIKREKSKNEKRKERSGSENVRELLNKGKRMN